MAGAKLNVTVLGIFLVVALLLSGADEEPGKDRALFRPGDVANKYTRGCESSEECRGK